VNCDNDEVVLCNFAFIIITGVHVKSSYINPRIANLFDIHIMLMGRGKMLYISSSRTPTDKISTATPMFSKSSCSMMLSTMSPEVVLYRK